jgi:hypothetical protein
LEVGRLLARLSLHPYGARNKQLEISLNNWSSFMAAAGYWNETL